MKFIEYIFNFIKSKKKILFAFLSGVVLFFLYVYLWYKSETIIPPGIRLLQYSAILIILFSLYIFLVKKSKVILSNLVLLFVLIFVLETVLFFVLGMPPAKRKYFNNLNLPKNHIANTVGSFVEPDTIYHKKLEVNNNIVFDVEYTIDKYRKRITPDHSLEKRAYALFFGCSIAFGEGVEDNETFPYYFQESSEKYNAYNFAISGDGTNHMLAKLENLNLYEQVKEKDGVAFYVFFWDHIYRAIGSMSRYTDWLTYAPYYYLHEGKLVRNKLFINGRKLISGFYQIIHQSNIVKYFKIDFPVELSDKHFDLVTEMILESKKKYKAQFGNDEFYVVIYPAYPAYTTEQFITFKQYLDMKQIKYFDLNEVLTYAPEHTLGGDPHPNAQTHKYLAQKLLEKYNLIKKNT